MYKKSMAKNHLSKAASKGRYGDTEIRSVDGQPSHVNKVEADWIDMYGAQGEALTKALGTGNINPKTGLKEYPWWLVASAVASAVSAGVGAYSAWKGGKEQASQASTQSKLIGQQQQELEESLGSLEGVKSSKELVARREYDQAVGDLSMRTGQSKEDLMQQQQGIMQKSGLATAGGATAKASQMYRRIQSQFGRGSQSLLGNLGKSMAGVEEWYEGEKSRIQSESKRLGLQKDLAEEQSGAWYLGKNVEKALGGG